MLPVCLCFEVHQPVRVKKNVEKSIPLPSRYFDSELNKHLFDRIAHKCYYPATRILLEAMDQLKGEKRPFKVAFSITGTWVEQASRWHPDLIELFRQFPRRNVEFLAETCYHSLASLFQDKGEYVEQIKEHMSLMKSLFRQKPKVLTNTEMVYNNVIGRIAAELGFEGIFTEGVPRILGWRSPNYLYRPPPQVTARDIKILLRNRRLTDDIGYRFSARTWDQWPLTADKWASWLVACQGQCLNVFLDYETFGEHHWEDSGIFCFLKALPHEVLKWENLHWALPTEVVRSNKPVGEFDVFEFNTISWADMEMDVSAWLGNGIQRLIFAKLEELGEPIKKLGDADLTKVWRYLQASDLLHHLCTKGWGDGTVHSYFSYFDNQLEGSAAVTEILMDLVQEIGRRARS